MSRHSRRRQKFGPQPVNGRPAHLRPSTPVERAALPVLTTPDDDKHLAAELLGKLGKDSIVGFNRREHIVLAVIRCADFESAKDLHDQMQALMRMYHPLARESEQAAAPRVPANVDPYPPPLDRPAGPPVRKTQEGIQRLDSGLEDEEIDDQVGGY